MLTRANADVRQIENDVLADIREGRDVSFRDMDTLCRPSPSNSLYKHFRPLTVDYPGDASGMLAAYYRALARALTCSEVYGAHYVFYAMEHVSGSENEWRHSPGATDKAYVESLSRVEASEAHWTSGQIGLHTAWWWEPPEDEVPGHAKEIGLGILPVRRRKAVGAQPVLPTTTAPVGTVSADSADPSDPDAFVPWRPFVGAGPLLTRRARDGAVRAAHGGAANLHFPAPWGSVVVGALPMIDTIQPGDWVMVGNDLGTVRSVDPSYLEEDSEGRRTIRHGVLRYGWPGTLDIATNAQAWLLSKAPDVEWQHPAAQPLVQAAARLPDAIEWLEVISARELNKRRTKATLENLRVQVVEILRSIVTAARELGWKGTHGVPLGDWSRSGYIYSLSYMSLDVIMHILQLVEERSADKLAGCRAHELRATAANASAGMVGVLSSITTAWFLGSLDDRKSPWTHAREGILGPPPTASREAPAPPPRAPTAPAESSDTFTLWRRLQFGNTGSELVLRRESDGAVRTERGKPVKTCRMPWGAVVAHAVPDREDVQPDDWIAPSFDQPGGAVAKVVRRVAPTEYMVGGGDERERVRASTFDIHFPWVPASEKPVNTGSFFFLLSKPPDPRWQGGAWRELAAMLPELGLVAGRVIPSFVATAKMLQAPRLAQSERARLERQNESRRKQIVRAMEGVLAAAGDLGWSGRDCVPYGSWDVKLSDGGPAGFVMGLVSLDALEACRAEQAATAGVEMVAHLYEQLDAAAGASRQPDEPDFVPVFTLTPDGAARISTTTDPESLYGPVPSSGEGVVREAPKLAASGPIPWAESIVRLGPSAPLLASLWTRLPDGRVVDAETQEPLDEVPVGPPELGGLGISLKSFGGRLSPPGQWTAAAPVLISRDGEVGRLAGVLRMSRGRFVPGDTDSTPETVGYKYRVDGPGIESAVTWDGEWEAYFPTRLPATVRVLTEAATREGRGTGVVDPTLHNALMTRARNLGLALSNFRSAGGKSDVRRLMAAGVQIADLLEQEDVAEVSRKLGVIVRQAPDLVGPDVVWWTIPSEDAGKLRSYVERVMAYAENLRPPATIPKLLSWQSAANGMAWPQ